MVRCFLSIVMVLILGSPVYAGKVTVGFLVGVGGLGDESYNDMTLTGIAQARRQYGCKVVHELSDATEKGIEAAVKDLISANADIIVSNRIAFPNVLHTTARRHPDKRFILNDMPWGNLANMVSIGYAHNEGSFLVGALAGWMTESGKVGFIGGTDLEIIRSFSIGFREGVAHANPDVQVTELFVAEGQDASGFNNPRKGFKIASDLYRQGLDIIFAAAGLSGNGVIHAAKTNGKYVIGVDTDQDHMARGLVLTSMMKRLDKATFQEVSGIIEGRFHPGVKYYGLKQDGVGLSPMTYTKHLIPRPVLEKLEKTKMDIITGKIKVTDEAYLGESK